MTDTATPPTGDYIQMDAVDWVPFPQGLRQGPIRWKLLHVAPEAGAWTAIFDCPAGSSFAKHIHMGPASRRRRRHERGERPAPMNRGGMT